MFLANLKIIAWLKLTSYHITLNLREILSVGLQLITILIDNQFSVLINNLFAL